MTSFLANHIIIKWSKTQQSKISLKSSNYPPWALNKSHYTPINTYSQRLKPSIVLCKAQPPPGSHLQIPKLDTIFHSYSRKLAFKTAASLYTHSLVQVPPLPLILIYPFRKFRLIYTCVPLPHSTSCCTQLPSLMLKKSSKVIILDLLWGSCS